jgi:hypothetical protein
MDLSPLKSLFDNADKIMAAARNNPLGIIALFLALVFAVGLFFFFRESRNAKILMFLAMMSCGVWAVMIGMGAVKKTQPPNPSPVPFEGHEITYVGRVLDRDTHLPVQNAEVTINIGKFVEKDFTVANGTYRVKFENAKPGSEADLYVQEDAYEPYTDHLTAADVDSMQQVRLTPRKKRPTPERQSATYGGRVLDAKSHSPVAGAKVTLGLRQPVYTDSEGVFLFDLPAPLKGNVSLSVIAEGYVPYETTLNKEKTGTIDVRLTK